MVVGLVRLYVTLHLLGVAYVQAIRPLVQGAVLQTVLVTLHLVGAGLSGKGYLRCVSILCLFDAVTLGVPGALGWLLTVFDLAQGLCLLVLNLDG